VTTVMYHPSLALRPGRPRSRPVVVGSATTSVAVVVPSYKVADQLPGVLRGIGPEVTAIYVVDDRCPDNSGAIAERVKDPRVRVIRHDSNRGVGAATVTGIRQAIRDGADIIVKMDGDGQMDPRLLPVLIDIVRSGEADYAKGNRFYEPEGLSSMPPLRLVGNAGLSFLAKLSTGYWQTFDPTNGYFAIHAEIARRLPLHKLSERYFFETDLLFRLNTLQARVVEVPMPAIYGNERSNLRIHKIILPFLAGHLRNFVKRIGYNYFLRGFSLASIELLAGLTLVAFGVVYGIANWSDTGPGSTAGTVMLAALPIILGFQMLLAFFSHDVQSAPATALHPRLVGRANEEMPGLSSPPIQDAGHAH
jgi:dolichol-phosphate mannosyltransferase